MQYIPLPTQTCKSGCILHILKSSLLKPLALFSVESQIFSCWKKLDFFLKVKHLTFHKCTAMFLTIYLSIAICHESQKRKKIDKVLAVKLTVSISLSCGD